MVFGCSKDYCIKGPLLFTQFSYCSEMVSASPFTPFSVLLGNMVKEVHKCLLDQLKVESSFIVISQLIKVSGHIRKRDSE